VTVDLVFPALGNTLPTDHAYALYGALSQIVPDFHDETKSVRFAPITGRAGQPCQEGQFAFENVLLTCISDGLFRVAPSIDSKTWQPRLPLLKVSPTGAIPRPQGGAWGANPARIPSHPRSTPYRIRLSHGRLPKPMIPFSNEE